MTQKCLDLHGTAPLSHFTPSICKNVSNCFSHQFYRRLIVTAFLLTFYFKGFYTRVQFGYLDVRMSSVRSSKLPGGSFFFAVWVKLRLANDRNWFPLIAKSKGLCVLQSFFVSSLNRKHDRDGLINHALCE